jgi:hypothetical protein
MKRPVVHQWTEKTITAPTITPEVATVSCRRLGRNGKKAAGCVLARIAVSVMIFYSVAMAASGIGASPNSRMRSISSGTTSADPDVDDVQSESAAFSSTRSLGAAIGTMQMTEKCRMDMVLGSR